MKNEFLFRNLWTCIFSRIVITKFIYLIKFSGLSKVNTGSKETMFQSWSIKSKILIIQTIFINFVKLKILHITTAIISDFKYLLKYVLQFSYVPISISINVLDQSYNTMECRLIISLSMLFIFPNWKSLSTEKKKLN